MKPDTTLSALLALVQSPGWRRTDRTESAVRSIQQSLRVEGVTVTRENVLLAIRKADPLKQG
jgi:hypothetical protein